MQTKQKRKAKWVSILDYQISDWWNSQNKMEVASTEHLVIKGPQNDHTANFSISGTLGQMMTGVHHRYHHSASSEVPHKYQSSRVGPTGEWLPAPRQHNESLFCWVKLKAQGAVVNQPSV